MIKNIASITRNWEHMSDLLTIVISVLAFFAGAAAAWFAWKALFPPDRRLELSTSEGPEGPEQTLVTISSRGKHGVSPEQFGEQPLTLTLDPPARSVISKKLSTNRTPMECQAQDGKLIIKPGLIAADESLFILVDTGDARTAMITHHDHQMPEVKFTKARSGRKTQLPTNEKRRPKALGAQLVVSVAVAVGSLVGIVLPIADILAPPSLSLVPKPVSPGETATLCGSDLHPFDVVNIDLDYWAANSNDRRVGTGQVDANGDFCVPFRIPEATKLGNSDLVIQLADNGDSRYYRVEMSVVAKQ